jgi:hypothetical protein
VAKKKPNRGKTLWEMLLDALSGPMEGSYHNPLKGRIGGYVTFGELDLRDNDSRILELREYKRRIAGRDYFFADYVLQARPLNAALIEARLRLTPVAKADATPDRTHDALFLSLDDDLPYSEELHDVVRADTKEFQILQDGEVAAQFWRINDVRESHRATVTVVQDTDRDGKAERSEVETFEVEYWDYWRETTDADGLKMTEFLFVEMSKEDGWFQVWRGRPVDPQKAVVV